MNYKLVIDFPKFVQRSLFVLPKPKFSKKAHTEENREAILRKFGDHLTSLTKKLNPYIDSIAFYDSKGVSWRKELDQNYSQTGIETSNTDIDKFNTVVDVFKSNLIEEGMPFFELDGFEAKDLISYKIDSDGKNYIIWSNDQLLMQKVSQDPKRIMLYPNTRTIYTIFQDVEDVRFSNLFQYKLNEISPYEELLKQILMGCSQGLQTIIKNGKRGIGPSTSKKIISQMPLDWKVDDLTKTENLEEFADIIRGVVRKKIDLRILENRIRILSLNKQSIPLNLDPKDLETECDIEKFMHSKLFLQED